MSGEPAKSTTQSITQPFMLFFQVLKQIRVENLKIILWLSHKRTYNFHFKLAIIRFINVTM